MYLIVALAVTILVIALAWRGIGTTRNGDQNPLRMPPRAPLPRRDRAPRVVAPDDDPEFLSEIDRKLRGEDKSG